jgi:S1-C subfamily serine protease
MSMATRMMAAMAGLICAGVAFAAPVPPTAPPDPLGRGYLGITVRDGLTIFEIQPNLPASRAGLKSGDRIVRVGSLEPQAFEQVIATVCSYRPGATVEIEVARGSERKIFRITLTARPAEADNPNRGTTFPIFPDD